MDAEGECLNPSAAARMLGISAKALRVYERQGLLKPLRTAAGWRVYGPKELARARDVVAMRTLGLSLACIAGVLDRDARQLEGALSSHQSALEERMRQLADAAAKVRAMRAELANGSLRAAADLGEQLRPWKGKPVAFDLPWPWGGERFELRELRPLNYLTGPLGSGKTRFALLLAEALLGASFLELDRAADGAAAARAKLSSDPALTRRVDQAITWLLEDGADASDAMLALLVGVEAEGATALVVDMVEQGLNEATQTALMAYLRRRGPAGRPLFLMTRSNVILDLDAVGPDETIIYCPANHAPPIHVSPYPGGLG